MINGWKCPACGVEFSGCGDGITVHGISGFHQEWCWKCAGYDYPNSRFICASGRYPLAVEDKMSGTCRVHEVKPNLMGVLAIPNYEPGDWVSCGVIYKPAVPGRDGLYLSPNYASGHSGQFHEAKVWKNEVGKGYMFFCS